MPFILRDTITETFLARIEESRDHVGFVYRPEKGQKWKEIRFGEFYDQVKRVSYGLMNLGIEPGDRVAVLSRTRIEWSLSDMAILGARAVTIPIYPTLTPKEVGHLLNDSEAKAAFIENAEQLRKILDLREEKADSLPFLKKIVVVDPSAMRLAVNRNRNEKGVLSLQALAEIGERQEKLDPQIFDRNLRSAKPSDPITICYTTGTTGVPKGVVLSHQNLMSVLEDCLKRLERHIRPESEVLLSFLPFSHVLGKVESMSVYPLGARQAFAESPERLSRNLREIRPTLLFAVPRIFEKAYATVQAVMGKIPSPLKGFLTRPGVLRSAALKPIALGFGGRLRFAICGGAALSREIGEFFDTAGIRILEGYGLTETCAPVTLNDPDHPKYGSVGRPLTDVEIRTTDDGEILIRSKKVFAGYNKMPHETEEALRGGWLHTGDVGHIDSEGFLHVTDRKKDIIVTSTGKNIAPQKIEKLAHSQRWISELMVYGDGKSFVTALLTLDREAIIAHANGNNILFSEYSELIKNPKIILLVQRAIDEINRQLPHHEKIRKFLILPEDFSVESGELTPSLKIRRKAVQKRYQAQLDRLYRQ